MTTKIGVALSHEHDQRAAAIEAASSVSAQLDGRRADLSVILAGGSHLAAPETTLDAIHETLNPDVLIGCGSAAVFATNDQAVTDNGVSVWAASFDSGSATPVIVNDENSNADALVGASGLVLLADLVDQSLNHLLGDLSVRDPRVALAGAVVAEQLVGGGTALFLNHDVVEQGAVGARLDGVDMECLLARGAIPVGPEFTVTRADGNVVAELAGQPALAVLHDTVAAISPHELELAEQGVYIGVVINPNKPEYGVSDYLIRGVIGVDRDSGAIAIGYPIEVGDVVRVYVRDPSFAVSELDSALRSVNLERPAGALVFSCAERAPVGSLVPTDIEICQASFGTAPFAGCLSAGELGKVDARYLVHAFCASVAIFH